MTVNWREEEKEVIKNNSNNTMIIKEVIKNKESSMKSYKVIEKR